MALDGALSTIGIVVGVEGYDDAKDQLKKGEITQDEYDELMYKANLATVSGAIGVTKNLISVSDTVAKSVAKSLGSEITGKAARFAPVVGSVLGLSLSVMGTTTTAISADKARKKGNHGQAAVYGTMSALNAVTVVLDAVSLGFRFYSRYRNGGLFCG